MNSKIIIIILIVSQISLFSCKETYYPKPHGYLTTDFPQKEYKIFDSAFPYTFEIPSYEISNSGLPVLQST